MLSKNNFNERLRKMEMQAKQDHFSIRKLSIGAASVLLGFTFFGMGSQSVQADTVTPASQIKEATNQPASTESAANNESVNTAKKVVTAPKDSNDSQTKKADNDKKEQKLDTYEKLSKFLRDSVPVTVSDGDAVKPAETPSTAKPNQKPTVPTGTNTASDITADNGTTAPADTNKPADDKLPADADIASATAKPNQKPVTTDPAAGGATITNSDKPTAPDQDDKKKPVVGTQDGQTANVYSWGQLMDAFNNVQISKIEIMEDIDNNVGKTGDIYVNLAGDRNLVIESNPADGKRHIIDYKDARVASGSGYGQGHLTLTYSNLSLYCSTYYGVADSYFNVSTFNFDNIDFHGSQMVYALQDTDVHFFGKNVAETISIPYTSPVGGDTVGGDTEDQQLLEFTGSSKQSVTFEEGSELEAATTYGNVLEMTGSATVTLKKNAKVTLNPGANHDGKNSANYTEYGHKASAIYMSSKAKIEVNEGASLNINVGMTNINASKPNTEIELQDQFTGDPNSENQFSAITLTSTDSTITIQDGGAVNINTNGDISKSSNNSNSNSNAYTVVYDGGNMKALNGGSLKITGKNMQRYSGTMLYIQGSADVENGTFDIELQDDPDHPNNQNYGAGTGKITLVDVSSTGNLTVNNPQNLVLNASLNKATGTSIIGNSEISIMNVRQEFDFPGMPKIVLPPFHILDVKKTLISDVSTIAVNKMELLNGKKTLTSEMITSLVHDISTNPDLAGLSGILGSALGGTQDPIKLLNSLVGISFDEIFPTIIQTAFSNVNNPGYNYIHMIPANPSGFLGIQDAKATINKDGSRTITGSITGYNKDTDGPKSDDFFNRLIEGGTNAYVIAKFNSVGSTLNGQTWKNPSQVDKPSKTEFSTPYQDTDLVGNPQTIPAGSKIDSENQTLTLSSKGMTFNGTSVPGGAVLDFKNHAVFLNGSKVAPLPPDLNWPLPAGMGTMTLPSDTAFWSPLPTDPTSQLSSEFAAKVNDDNTFTFTIPADICNQLSIGAHLELTPEANFVQYGKGVQPYSVDLLKKSTAEAITDARKQLDAAYQDALNVLANSGLDPDDTYKASIDQAYHAAIAGGEDDSNPSADKTNSIYGVANDNSDASINEINNRAQNAIDKMYHSAYDSKLDKFVSDKQLVGAGIADSVNKEKAKIEAATGKDAIVQAETQAESDLSTNVLQYHKALDAINQAYQDAQNRIKNSGLSASEQDQYNQALDQAYNAAIDKTDANSKDSIFATNNADYINNRKQRALNKFNKEAAKAETAGYADQIKNDLRITGDNKLIDDALAKGEGLIDGISEGGTTAPDNSQLITEKEKTAKDGILAAAKTAAKDLLAQKEKAVDDALDKLSTLTGDNLAAAKQKAKDIVTAADTQVDAAQDEDGVKDAYNNGIENLNGLLNSETNKDKRGQAVQAIKDERDKVVAALDKDKGKYPNLTDDHRQQLINDANNAADTGIDTLATANDSEVEGDKDQAITNIDNVLANAASENQTDKENKENVVNNAKNAALSKLKDAYDAATSKVNGYKDTQVSSSDKSKIINQLTTDYQAAQSAINTATNTADVNTAEQKGEDKLNQDAAQADLEAAKSDAITDLDTARDKDLQAVEDAHANHLITDEQCTNMKDKINSFHDAGTSAINKDTTKDQVSQDKQTAIDEMQGVVDGISDTTLSNSKSDALKALEAAATAAKKHIDGLTSLGQDEKNTLKGKVDQALNDAEIAVNTATTPNDVTSIESNAKTEFTNISADADLQNAKNAGKHQLDNKQKEVDDAIDALKNLDTQSKDALKQSVQAAYDAALDKVNNPSPATTAQVGKNAQAGCDAMQDILDKAQGLDTVKDQDKVKLDQAAQDAKDRIKQTNLTDTQKQDAYTAIDNARDTAKANVDKATDSPSANEAEKDGETAIADAEATANRDYLNGLKDQADKDIDTACDNAEKDLANEWATLTDSEKDEAKPAFDKAKNDIEAARTQGHNDVKAAKNKQDIDAAVNTAQNTAAVAENPALLASAKAKGKQAIKDYGEKIKGQLTNQTDKDTVDSLVTDAVNEIDNTDQTPTAVDTTVKNYKQKIDGVKNTAASNAAAAINTAKQDAITALNNKLNGDGKGNKGVLDQIDDLKDDLTQDQLTYYQDQASKAHDDAVNNVKGDSDIAQINDDRNTGISGMQAALDAASLQAAKNKANEKLKQDAQAAIDKINGMTNLTDKQKHDAIDKVNNAISTKPDGGQYEINQATDQSKIPDIVNDTENAINTITGNASNDAFTAAQSKAKGNLEEIAKNLKQKIKDDLAAGKLSEIQANGTDGKGGLNAEVDNALSTAEGKIDAATDQAGIDQAESGGKQALDTASDDINKDEAQKADLDKVAAAVSAAEKDAKNYLAEHPNMTGEQKQSVYDAIDKISSAANDSINKDRQDSENAIDKMNADANEAVGQLTNLTNGWDTKEKAVEKLKAHAKADQSTVANTNPDFDQLTPTEIAAAKEAIHTAQRAGENTIFGLDPNKDDVDKVEQGCETDVDNALLPYKLLNKQHHQTTALNDYASGKDGQSGDAAINAMPNLTAQEKADYKQQIDAARQEAAKNINGVKLPDKPTSDDYTAAAKEAEDAEKAGENAVDAIINKAKLNDDKRQADKDLEDAANKAKTDNPDLADDIAKVVSAAEKQIADTTVADSNDPNSPEGIKNTAVDKINKLIDGAKVNKHKDNAIKKLDQEKADADKIIDRSQLTSEQKVAAHKKLQDLYDEAQKRLEDNKKDEAGQSLSAAAYEKETEQIANDYQKMIDRVIKQNQENTTYPWFDNEADNAHGDLSDKWNSFEGSLSDPQKDKYKDLIDTVNESIKQLDKSQDGHKTSIADATQTYDDGLTALNKLKAIKDVEDAEAAANDAINNSSNLTGDQKKPYEDQVNSDANNAINNILGVTPSANDTIGNQDAIDKAKGDVVNDMNTLVNKAKNDDGKLADAKLNAAAKIDAAYNSAKKKLGAAYQQDGELDHVHQHELDQLNGLSLDALQNVDDAIKNVDKAAVNEAGTYAKGQIDNLTNFTDHQKEALKGQIDKDVAAATGDQGTITMGTTDPDTVTKARDTAIDTILADAKGDSNNDKDALANDPAVQLDNAKAQAEKDLETVYNAAKNKLPKGTDTTELDNAYKNNKNITGSTPKAVKDAVKAAEQAIAKGAIKDAANAAKNHINNLTHGDGSAYTDAEKNALNTLIDSDVSQANKAINNSAQDKDGISQEDAEAATNDGTVSGALNDNLAIIAGDSAGNTDADHTALANDPAVQKEQAKAQLQKNHDKAVGELHDKFGNDADTSKVDAANDAAQKAIDDPKNTTVEDVQKAETAGEKEISKGVVEDAQTAAGKLIQNIKHTDNTPYTSDEQAALTNAVQNVVDKTNGKDGQQGLLDTTDDVDKTRQDSMQDILETVTDGTGKNQAALNDDPTVQHDRELKAAKTQAEKDLQTVYNAAKNNLPNGADTTNLDNAFNHHAPITGDSVEAIKEAAKKAEQDIAKGAIMDAANAAKNNIKNLTHKGDGSAYTDAEKNALETLIDEDVSQANKAINNSAQDKDGISQEDAEAATNDGTVSGTLNDQLATIASDSAGNTDADHTALANDPAVQKEQAKAQLQKNHDKAVGELHDKFGKDADTSKVDAANKDAQKAIDGLDANANVDDIHNAEAAGEREISKGVVEDAQTAAGKLIQNIKHKDTNKPYTADEQAALTNAVQATVDKTNGKDGQQGSLDTTNDVDKTRQDAMQDILETVTDGTSKNQAALNDDPTVQHNHELQAAKQKAKDKLQQAYNTAIHNGVAKEEAGPVQTAANTAIDNATNQDKINDAELAGEKDLAKLEVQAAANKAKQAVDKLTNHKDGTPYTNAEKQAIKDAIQHEVDKANGTKDNQGTIEAANTVSDVDTAKQTAIEAINKIKGDCDNSDEAEINAIINQDSKVEQERRDKQSAQRAIRAAADKARQDLGVEKNSKEAAAINKAEQDALDAINQVTDGKYEMAENSGLANVVEAEKNTAKDQLGSGADTTAIDAITSADTTSANVVEKQSAIKTAFDASKKKQSAITTANDAISTAHQAALDQLHHQYGPNADTSKTDAAFNNHHVAQGDTVEAINADALEAEKEIAKGEVADAAANAKDKIDHLTNKPNGTPYTDAEKQALKDKVDKEINDYVTQGNQAITASDTADKVNKAKDDAINNINNAISDNNLADILNKDPNVAKNNAETAIDNAVAEANAAIDNNKNWSKEQKDKLKHKVTQDAQAGKGKIEHDSDIDTINQDKDSTISQIKNDYTDQATINTIIGNGTNNSLSSNAEPVQQPVQHSDEGEKDLILMHNAYLYDENGERANMVDLKAGSVVETYGKEKIGDKDYFVLIDHGANDKKYYVVCTNINSVHTTLKHNAYVYDEYGQRIKSRHAIKAGTNIATFGDAVTIRGIKYYIIGENKFVRATNVSETEAADTETVTKTAKVEATVGPISDKPDAPVQKKIMHNAYAYNDKGVRANGLIFSAGTVILTTGAKSIDGVLYYELDDGMYIKAANIDAKKLRLQHNAYIYSQYGNREGKRVLKKHKLVKTYGDPISIHGKKYYITAKGKFVKKANFDKK